MLFASSTPTVGIFFVTPERDLLLSVRGIDPHKGMLDAFGGFVDSEETFEQCAVRELNEELGVSPGQYGDLHYLCSAIGHYPYGGEVKPVLSSFFWAEIADTSTITPADDVAAIERIPLDKVNFDLLHDDDIKVGVKALQRLFAK